MLRFVVRRLLLLIPILVGVSLLIFFWIRALPGARRSRCSVSARRRRSSRPTGSGTGSTSRSGGSTSPTCKTTAVDRDLGVSVATASRGLGRDPPAVPRDDRACGRGDDLRGRRSASRSASSPRSGTGGSSTTSTLVGSLIGISIPIFFLAIILKYMFAVRLASATERRPRSTSPSNAKHPTNFYVLDAIIDARLVDALGRAEAPGAARRSRSARSRSR